jgi:prepilin-type N-terminal cleavage/methylation domain-containing protein
MTDAAAGRARANGFSLVEVVVAMLILTVGLLAMAATSGYMAVQIRVADLRTERMAAVQQVIEDLRSLPFDELEPRPKASAASVGAFRVWWDLEPQGTNLVELRIHSEGPGYRAGTGWVTGVEETLSVSVARLKPPSAAS